MTNAEYEAGHEEALARLVDLLKKLGPEHTRTLSERMHQASLRPESIRSMSDDDLIQILGLAGLGLSECIIAIVREQNQQVSERN